MLEDKDLRSIQEVRQKVEAAYEAFQKFRSFSQEQVDAIVDRAAAAARANAVALAELAVEETGYGNAKDKTAKNLLNSDLLHQKIRHLKTIGVIAEKPEEGLVEIAEPVGVVAAILPTTNPTSTVFYKTLISIKAGNAIVLAPHPRAVRCSCESARILREAALQAGAPEGLIQCLESSTIQGTNELMRHKRTGIILSTGGQGIVRAAYSSGKPALGVGPGNVPVLLDASADVGKTVASVVDGKSFDFGTVCSSEQTLVAEESRREQVWAALKANKAYICNQEQSAALEKLLIGEGFRINPDCVGQAPQKIAQMAGFSIPDDERIMVVELKGIGREFPMSAEKLSPVLSVHFVKDFEAAMNACAGVLNFGGRGHTCVIYSQDDARIREFGRRMPAFRILVNTSSPQGSTGITTNVFPAMTLGCGAMAGNSTGDNVGPMHLFHVKRIAWHVRDAETAFQSPEAKAYFAGLAMPAAAVSANSVGSGGSKIADAVGRYLQKRGLSGESAAAPAVMSTVVSNSVASVVDQFLAGRRAGNAARANAPVAVPAAVPAAAAEPVKNESPAIPAPEVNVADFVCEDDVRRARTLERKIYINKKTIITPAARDLDWRGEVIIETE